MRNLPAFDDTDNIGISGSMATPAQGISSQMIISEKSRQHSNDIRKEFHCAHDTRHKVTRAEAYPWHQKSIWFSESCTATDSDLGFQEFRFVFDFQQVARQLIPIWVFKNSHSFSIFRKLHYNWFRFGFSRFPGRSHSYRCKGESSCSVLHWEQWHLESIPLCVWQTRNVKVIHTGGIAMASEKIKRNSTVWQSR